MCVCVYKREPLVLLGVWGKRKRLWLRESEWIWMSDNLGSPWGFASVVLGAISGSQALGFSLWVWRVGWKPLLNRELGLTKQPRGGTSSVWWCMEKNGPETWSWEWTRSTQRKARSRQWMQPPRKDGRGCGHDHKRRFYKGSGTQLWVQVMVTIFAQGTPAGIL